MNKRAANKERKRKAILDAALMVFAEKGVAVANIAEVAQLACVGKGTIYEYYRSKEDLFFAVFEKYVEDLIAGSMVEISQLGGDESRRLTVLLEAVFRSALEHLEYFSIFFEFWSAAGNPATRDKFRAALLSMYDAFRTLIARLVSDGKQSGVFDAKLDEHSVAAGLVGAMDGLMLQGWMDRSFDAQKAAADFFDIFIAGMRPSKGAETT